MYSLNAYKRQLLRCVRHIFLVSINYNEPCVDENENGEDKECKIKKKKIPR